MFPAPSEDMASSENAMRPTVRGLFGSAPTPWMAYDLDAKEEGVEPQKRQIRLTGIIAVSLDRRREFEAKAQVSQTGSFPSSFKFRELQGRLDFMRIVQHFPWWRPRIKGRALRAGRFYSILMTDQGEVFGGVADHVTVCPDMKGGAFVHTHLVKADAKQGDHLKSLRDRAEGKDLRPSSRRLPVGWLRGAGEAVLPALVGALGIFFISLVWHKAAPLLDWLVSESCQSAIDLQCPAGSSGDMNFGQSFAPVSSAALVSGP